LVLAIALVPPACGRKKIQVPVAAAPAPILGVTEEGMASWYGHPYHGRRAASGETYDMEQMTAAHRTLPFGVRVRVVNLDNGRETEVRINDRGPFVRDRIIDLSRAAARRIQMLGPGTARVRLRVVGLPEQEPPGGFFAVQIGSFRDRGNAQRLREAMARQHGAADIQRYDSPRGLFHRVVVGRAQDLPAAEDLLSRLRAQGHDGFVVRVDSPL
jgi:rare lipoprotein A